MSEYKPIELEAFSSGLLDEDSLSDSGGRLEIHLIDKSNKKRVVRFDAFVAYRKLDEGDALNILAEISATAKLGHVIYQVRNSKFLDWFHRESNRVREGQNLQHVCVTTPNSIIDVITFDDPVIF